MTDVTPISKLRSRRIAPREGERIICRPHVDWVWTLPCCVTGSFIGVVPHHLMTAELSAMGLRSSDIWIIPLLARLHTGGPETLHGSGNERRWLAYVGVDGIYIARRLTAASIVAGRIPANDNEKRAARRFAGDVDAWIAQGYRERRAA